MRQGLAGTTLRAAMWRWRRWLISLGLVLTLVLTPPDAESYGDNLQIALPLAGLGCAIAGGGAGEYFLRFAGLWITVHATKRLAGEAEFNLRPNDSDKGFPSGHTAAAVFGASSLVHDCIRDAPVLRLAVIVGAAFTGASRIEAGEHDIWQVLAGAILALLFERLLRRPRLARRAAMRRLAQARHLGLNVVKSVRRLVE